MKWIDHTQTNNPVAVFLGRLAQSAAALVKASRHRREVMRLSELDDHMLKDIGLTRSLVRGALAEPILSDPSRVLVQSVPRHKRETAPPVRRTRPVVQVAIRQQACP